MSDIKWTPEKPKEAGFYYIEAVGDLTGRHFTTVVKVYESRPGNWCVFYDGDNYTFNSDRFAKRSTRIPDPK